MSHRTASNKRPARLRALEPLAYAKGGLICALVTACRVSFGMAAIALAGSVSGCTVVSIEEDRLSRAQQSEAFDATTYVNQIWTEKTLPSLSKNAHPVETVLSALNADIRSAGKSFGRQAGEGSPYTFTVSGIGEVVSVDRSSPAGTAKLKVGGSDLNLQIGPYVSGTALRDSQAYINFNDFSNQIAFASVSKALNDKAVLANRQVIQSLKPAQKLRFVATFAKSAETKDIVLTPVVLEVVQ